MIGTLINCTAIVAGSLLGLLFRRSMKESLSRTISQGVGLSITLIGVMGAVKTENTLLMILSMVLGGIIGSLVDIEGRMNRLGDWAQSKLVREGDGSFAKGFVTASLMFCIGAMAVVGALDSGIRGDHSTLIAKAALDGVISVMLASSLGVGVMLSAVPVLVYQGSIALLGNQIAPFLSNAVVREISAVGGLLIVSIGLNMVLDKNIRVANLLPAILIPFLYYPIYQLFVR
mgnify:CR=1 FL=1